MYYLLIQFKINDSGRNEKLQKEGCVMGLAGETYRQTDRKEVSDAIGE